MKLKTSLNFLFLFTQTAFALRLLETENTARSLFNRRKKVIEYTLGELESYDCPSGSLAILRKNECQKFYDTESPKTNPKLYYLFYTDEHADNPAGCYRYYEDCWGSGTCIWMVVWNPRIDVRNNHNRNGEPASRVCSPTAGVGGDPHVTNLAGNNFDILALGSFSLLHFTQSNVTLFKAEGMIDRLGELCTQTFVKKLTFSGAWITEVEQITLLEMQAKPEDTGSALEMRLSSGTWEAPRNISSEITSTSSTEIILRLHKVTLTINTASHWGWNYLNLHFYGTSHVSKEVHLGGLLAYDDFTRAATPSGNCTEGNKAIFDILSFCNKLKYIIEKQNIF